MPRTEFDTDAIGRWSADTSFPVPPERAVAYAKATNDPIAAHLDGTLAPPVFAVVPTLPVLAEVTLAAVPDALAMRILHGEQDFRLHRPIKPGEPLTVRAKVVGIHGKSSGVIVTSVAQTRGKDDELVNEQYFSGFFRGGESPLQLGEAAPEHAFDESLRRRAPDYVAEQKFDLDQTFRYAEPAGDPVPIHLDEEFAKQMGLPGIIMHGLCTMAFTSHALLTELAPAHPERLRRLAVRFAAPGRPGQVMTTSVWRSGDAFRFESVNDEGTVLIKDGLAEFEGIQ